MFTFTDSRFERIFAAFTAASPPVYFDGDFFARKTPFIENRILMAIVLERIRDENLN